MILVAILCGCGHVEADRGSDAAPLFDASPWDASGPDAGDAAADAAVLFDAAPNPCDWPAYDGDACEGGLCRDGRCDGASCFVEGGWYADEQIDPLTECRFCEVETSRTSWQWLDDGTPCTDGICSEGGCAG